MSRDISSSSEDEVDEAPAQVSSKPKEIVKSNHYKCPDDFVGFSHKPCSSTLAKNLESTENELWLVKAPASFDPRCLRGVDVNLSGFQTLKLPSAAHGSHGVQLYNIVSSDRGPADLRLLTAGSSPAEIGPAFSGLLSICESYGGDRPSPHVIHADPAPDIIPGLKQRFQPFGSKTPTSACEDKKKKKKKKNRDMPIKIEDMPVKDEVEETGQEHRPKKRKKKDRDNDDDDEKEKVLMVEVKIEPEEDALLQEDEPTKKKKKKKKDRDNDDDDDDDQKEKVLMVEVKSETEEDALQQEDEPAKKKKKKKKSKREQD